MNAPGPRIRPIFQRVSEAPTNPQASPPRQDFDVAELYRGPVAEPQATSAEGVNVDEKLRQAYFWIVNTAIISPFYDIEYHEGPSQTFVFGDSKTRVTFPSGQSYSSFVLLPLLNLAVRRRCLLHAYPVASQT